MGALDETLGTPAKPAAPDVGGVAAAQARSDVKAEVEKKRRGRPPGSGTRTNQPGSGGTGTPGADAGTVSPELRAELNRQLEACFDPKAWGALLAAPGDVAVALTGHAHWIISQPERDTLGAAGSTAARFMSIQNPRTLALLMLGSALFAVYVPRLTQTLKIKKDAAAGKREPKREEEAGRAPI